MLIEEIKYISKDEENFPSSLLNMPDTPEGLYFMGNIDLLSTTCISVIGSRKVSTYGARCVNYFIPGLCMSNLSIVSGLAYGIDALSHKVALDNGGKCIAVLAGGLDNIYPSSNIPLLMRILANNGCVISEQPPGTQSYKSLFLRRNRLIAALSPVLLVIEAADGSGTLSTAQHALNYNKEVAVVMGDIFQPNFEGIIKLSKYAKPILTLSDILEMYQLSLPLEVTQLRPALTGTLAILYHQLSSGGKSTEELVAEVDLPISKVQSGVSVLELDGYISYLNGRWHTT